MFKRSVRIPGSYEKQDITLLTGGSDPDSIPDSEHDPHPEFSVQEVVLRCAASMMYETVYQ